MPTAISRPFKSADGRVTYVTMSSGQRRRVKIVDGEIVFHAREGKGAKKKCQARAAEGSTCANLLLDIGDTYMPDGTVKHAGYMPGNPSMNQGSGLAPDWENLGGSADDSTTLAAGDIPKGATSSMSQSAGVITTRIMEEGIDYTMPSSGQGNLEPQGPGVKGAG